MKKCKRKVEGDLEEIGDLQYRKLDLVSKKNVGDLSDNGDFERWKTRSHGSICLLRKRIVDLKSYPRAFS